MQRKRVRHYFGSFAPAICTAAANTDELTEPNANANDVHAKKKIKQEIDSVVDAVPAVQADRAIAIPKYTKKHIHATTAVPYHHHKMKQEMSGDYILTDIADDIISTAVITPFTATTRSPKKKKSGAMCNMSDLVDPVGAAVGNIASTKTPSRAKSPSSSIQAAAKASSSSSSAQAAAKVTSSSSSSSSSSAQAAAKANVVIPAGSQIVLPTAAKVSATFGNERAWLSFEEWVQKESERESKPIALMVGPAGIGKTTGVTKYMNKYHYTIIHLNASDEARSPLVIEEILKEKLIAKSLFGNRIAIVLDEIDGSVDTVGDIIIRTVALIQEMKKVTLVNPIVCIANEFSSATVRTLYKTKNKVRVFRMDRLHPYDLRKIIDSDSTASTILLEDEKCSIVMQANGDARSLQQLLSMRLSVISSLSSSMSSRDYSIDPFQTASFILGSNIINKFKTTEYMIDRAADDESSLLVPMVYENYLNWMQNSMDTQTNILNEMQLDAFPKQKEYYECLNSFAYIKTIAEISNAFSLDNESYGIRTVSYQMNKLPIATTTKKPHLAFPHNQVKKKELLGVQFAKQRICLTYEPFWTTLRNEKRSLEMLQLIQSDPLILLSAAGSLNEIFKDTGVSRKDIKELEESLVDKKVLSYLYEGDESIEVAAAVVEEAAAAAVVV